MTNKLLYFILVLTLLSCQENEKTNNSRVDILPFYKEATFTPNWMEIDDDRLNTFHKISSFNLTNQDGEIVSEKTFEGKIYITDFFFTSCGGICPRMTTNMKMLQDTFAKNDNVLFLSHSVTPDQDSVEVLKAYAENKGVISAKWHLVTGPQTEIYKLGRHDYFIEEDLGVEKSDEDFLHTENFVLIDKNKHIRGIYNGLRKNDLRQLIADVRTLEQED